MLTHDRDRQIVLLVDRFQQLTSGQIRDLLFVDLSGMPPFRALVRLVASKHLARIEKQTIGGNRGGSGQYVYQLGREGWKMCRREGQYYPQRAIHPHTLAIADTYVGLKKLEAIGTIKLIGFMNEYDATMTIGGVKLTPDLSVEVAIPARKQVLSLWLEIDMGTERPKQIKEKLTRYWHAYQNATTAHLETFPAVLFLAPDDARVQELKWIIGRGDKAAQSLFMVGKLSEFPDFVFA